MTRPTLAILLAGAVLFGAGCGGGHGASKPADRGPAPFAANQVSGFFHSVTGDALKVEPGATFDALAPDYQSGHATDRYGTFELFVVHRPGAAAALYRTQTGGPLKPDAQGVYWHETGGSWTAMKPYRNVVLEWTAEQHQTDARFKRLDSILSKLGRPASAVRAALPPEDQPCAARKIAPAAGPEGTCRSADGATVTIVDRSHRLRIPGMQLRVLKVKTGSLVLPKYAFGEIERAKGRFVYVGVGMRNSGVKPINGLDEAKLQVDGRTYDQDVGAEFEVTPDDAFPLQPGERGFAGLVFDIPARAARAAARRGVVVFPADTDTTTVDYADRLGEIRLGPSGPAAPAALRTQA